MLAVSTITAAPLFHIPFLIIPLLVAVDQLHKGFQAGVREGHTAKAGKLGSVALAAAGSGKTLPDIGRDKEGGALGAKVRVELREVDADARKVEVSEVDVLVGDFLQPGDQIPRLRVAGNQQEGRDAVTAELVQDLIPDGALPLRKAEVLHILNAHHNGVGGDSELKEVTDIKETPGAGAKEQFPRSQAHAKRADYIHRKARAGADGYRLGVSEKLHLLRAGGRRRGK